MAVLTAISLQALVFFDEIAYLIPMNSPWQDWIPGVLSDKQLTELGESRHIAELREPLVSESSFDLTISEECYELINGSIKPSGDSYARLLSEARLFRKHDLIEAGGEQVYQLEPQHSYLFKIEQRLNLPEQSGIYGQATSKSSVGRVDVITRLIVDGADEYDVFDPKSLRQGSGTFYLEVTPITFPVSVKKGIALSQLRLFYGHPDNCKFENNEFISKTCLKSSTSNSADGCLHVDLTSTKVRGHDTCVFWVSNKDEISTKDPIRLWKSDNKPNPCEYWRFKKPDELNRLVVEKDSFYLIRSQERLSLPGSVAVYCRAMDEALGEMRIHYAGFVHPWFGRERKDSHGTPLIFEVRGHDLNVNLCDGEKLARLVFYRMSDQAQKKSNDYQDQELKLSVFFADWPQSVRVDADGRVSANQESANV